MPRAAVQFVTPKRDRRGQAGEPMSPDSKLGLNLIRLFGRLATVTAEAAPLALSSVTSA